MKVLDLTKYNSLNNIFEEYILFFPAEAGWDDYYLVMWKILNKCMKYDKVVLPNTEMGREIYRVVKSSMEAVVS